MIIGMEQRDFEQMAHQWRKRAYDTGLALGATTDEAEDIAQDTLLKLWNLRDELERYRSVDALAVIVAKHLTIDMHRHNRTVALEALPDHLSIADNRTDAAIISRDEERQIAGRLARLPSRQHAVLVMRQVEHRSYDEIAALLGIEASSAKVLLSRARKWLLEQYQAR